MATSPSSSNSGTSPNYIVEFVDLVSAALDTPAIDGMLSLTGSGAAPSSSHMQVSSRVRQMFAKFKNFVKKSGSSTRLGIGRRVDVTAPEYQAATQMPPPCRRAFVPHIILIERVSVVSSPAFPVHDDELSATQSQPLHRTKSLPSIPHEVVEAPSPLSTPTASSCSSGSSVESPFPTTPLTSITEKVGGSGSWVVYGDFGPLTTDPFAKSAASPEILPPRSTAFRRPYLLSSSSNPNFHAQHDDDRASISTMATATTLRQHPSTRVPPTPPPAYPIPPTPAPRKKMTLVGGEPRGPHTHHHLPFPASSASPATSLPRTRAKRSVSVSSSSYRSQARTRLRTGLAPLPLPIGGKDNSSETPPVPSPSPRPTTSSLPSKKRARGLGRPSSPFPFTEANRASAPECDILQDCLPTSMSAPASSNFRLGPNEGGRGSPFPAL